MASDTVLTFFKVLDVFFIIQKYGFTFFELLHTFLERYRGQQSLTKVE